jgi:hypothetical protein
LVSAVLNLATGSVACYWFRRWSPRQVYMASPYTGVQIRQVTHSVKQFFEQLRAQKAEKGSRNWTALYKAHLDLHQDSLSTAGVNTEYCFSNWHSCRRTARYRLIPSTSYLYDSVLYDLTSY